MQFEVVSLILVLTLGLFSGSVRSADEINFEKTLAKLPLNWKGSDDVNSSYPFYVAGRDRENRLVIVVEIGRWNITRIGQASGDDIENVIKQSCKVLQYCKYPQLAYDSKLSNSSVATEQIEYEYEHEQVGVLVDFQGFPFTSVNAQSIRWALQWAAAGARILDSFDYIYMMNSAAGIDWLMGILRPAFGPLFSAIEVFGTNKERLVAKLRTVISQDQLPGWYGGSKNYKPVKVHA